MSNEARASISVRSVTKRYGSVEALRDISLDIEGGEFVALLGPSGCGKTTLLRSIAGLEDISSGTIAIGKRVISSAERSIPPEKRNLGFVFQSYALWPHMTVRKNVAYSLSVLKWQKARIATRVSEVLELVGMSGYEDRYPSELSGGQMQRIALARSIAPEPSVLLFDEPLSNLDAKLRERMRLEIRRLQQRLGTTALYVTHDQAEAMVVADRVVLMNEGVVVQEGSARELYNSPRTPFAADFLGATNFLTGELVAPGGPYSRIRLKSGREIEAASAGGATTSFEPGASVSLSVRPEAIGVSASHGQPASDDQTLIGEVVEAIFMGKTVELSVDTDAGSLRVELASMSPDIEGVDVGSRVRLYLPPDHVRVLVEEAAGEKLESEIDLRA